jgi:microcystin degradation protein MlrC
MRIAVASFSHETCTFNPTPTTVDDFEWGGVPRGQAVLDANRGVSTYINGFIKVADAAPDIELIGILDASHPRGGSSGSWLTQDCFDTYSHGIAEGISTVDDIDGVLLALHGAMAVTGVLKPEAEIVRRVRQVVGDKPIMVTLDLHANEDHELTEVADGVFIIKTYPHVDMEAIGMVAARCMAETVRGNVKPTMAIRKPGIITPSVFQGTGTQPAQAIMDRAKAWEEREPDVFCVSVAFGFAYADVPDVGATVIVVTNDNPDLAEQVAQDVSDFIWEQREPFAGKTLPKTQPGVAQAIEAAQTQSGLVIIADHSDRMGDSTHILQELITQQARRVAVVSIADANAIAHLQATAGVGDQVTLHVGGHTTEWAGTPVEITGMITFLDDCTLTLTGPMSHGATQRLGTVAVLRFGDDNHLVITGQLFQLLDDAILHAVGLNPDSIDILAIKSRVHFRAFYEDTAGAIIEIDAPGLGPADLRQHHYENIPDGLYPLVRS